ncbi:MAG: DUF3322 domain-containing protein [Pseudomonadota bacterium]
MSTRSAWSTPATIRAQVQRMWDDGRLLAARVSDAGLFPLELALRQPSVSELGEQFEAVRAWIRDLEAGSAYQIVWREINHRQLGRNRMPDKVVLASDSDALRLIGRRAQAQRFDQLAAATLALFPQLRDWIARRPLAVLAEADAWERVLAILSWFVAHPRPQLYARQLDIAGVDSKFIEARKVLLAELLDQVLPDQAIRADASGARQFEARFGLLSKPPLLRFRTLDPNLAICGLSDMTVPVAQFCALKIAARRVFITENEINGLAFPEVPEGLVIFGGGYGIDRLADVAWLRERDVVYWGDIDTHGFAILDRLRASMPHARSMLMDEATLLAHRSLWGQEDAGKRFGGNPTRLGGAELALFEALRQDRFGERVRMEQERLGYAWVTNAIAAG